MSNAILPNLPGIAWPRKRAPVWSTTKKTSVSGREYRSANWSYPRYEFELDFDVLRQGPADVEYAQLLGFINARQGSFDTFLYRDQWDNAVAGQVFGVGAAGRTKWQLARSFGGVVEPVFGIVEAPAIFVDGVLQVGAVVSNGGLVTMPAAPADGAVLTWSGSFYWRCRFMRDANEFSEMMWGVHDLQGLGFITVKGE